MVKLRAGKKKQSASKSDAIISGEFKRVHRLPQLPHIHYGFFRTRKGLLIAGIVLLVAILLVAGTAWYVRKAQQPPKIEGQTEEQYISNTISKLQANAPSASASDSEQVKHLDQLRISYALAGDHQKYVDTFKKRADIQSADLTYLDYVQLAKSLSALGNKDSAIASLDKAISLLPTVLDEDTGYDPAVMKSRLEAMKTELQK